MKERHAIASMGSLLADPGRSAMLLALLDGRALSAGELARAAEVSAQSASGHLAKLTEGGLVSVKQEGRCRYYKLSGTRVANALEALGAISTPLPVSQYRRGSNGGHVSSTSASSHVANDERMCTARSCYDHLAGRIAVALAEQMEKDRLIVPRDGRDYHVTRNGAEWLAKFGIEMEALQKTKRHLARRCLDWTERRPHISGALGAALLEYFLHEKWVARCRGTRALQVTEMGTRRFKAMLG